MPFCDVFAVGECVRRNEYYKHNVPYFGELTGDTGDVKIIIRVFSVQLVLTQTFIFAMFLFNQNEQMKGSYHESKPFERIVEKRRKAYDRRIHMSRGNPAGSAGG
jgi:hypothetical protein